MTRPENDPQNLLPRPLNFAQLYTCKCLRVIGLSQKLALKAAPKSYTREGTYARLHKFLPKVRAQRRSSICRHLAVERRPAAASSPLSHLQAPCRARTKSRLCPSPDNGGRTPSVRHGLGGGIKGFFSLALPRRVHG